MQSLLLSTSSNVKEFTSENLEFPLAAVVSAVGRGNEWALTEHLNPNEQSWQF
jgi:hypothetical protein